MICALDANLFVYTVGPPTDPRRTRSRDLIIRGMRNRTAILLLRALVEFSNVATRKLGIGADEVRRRVQAWSSVMPICAAAEEDLVVALQILRHHQFRFWDAMLCAKASRAGARYLLTEDLQDGRSLRRMAIVNPFAIQNNSLIDRILPP